MLPRSLLYSGVDGSLAHAELPLQSLDEFLVDFGYAVSADLAPSRVPSLRAKDSSAPMIIGNSAGKMGSEVTC